MSGKAGETAQASLTPRERLTRGLTYSAVGPVDVTRGVVGLSVQSAHSTATELRRRYREGRLARELAAAQETIGQELASKNRRAQEVVANLPQLLQEARRNQRRSKKPWLIAGAAGVVVLAGGAVAFSIVRRSSRPEPSPRPPSVDVQPRP
ncbi:cell wall synthesis protein CwsA [Mycobacterium asiaticum]|uniref:Cell wall synthesis protein CwsA n=1 Tax=Mycobacterium asiaticum TaxID=1790 RepID=A0A1A3NR21_MYCAS|nr:cell wall synthesis protein CwsA [Mycobacterium asiaticum]OBK23815.1 cell wall synthesis protein CwsA [Mycobacterium asiaticum]